jgi:hypothetical protein
MNKPVQLTDLAAFFLDPPTPATVSTRLFAPNFVDKLPSEQVHPAEAAQEKGQRLKRRGRAQPHRAPSG